MEEIFSERSVSFILFIRCYPNLQQGPGVLLPQLYPDGYVIDLRWRRTQMLVLDTWTQEVIAAGFQEVDIFGVMTTRFVPWTGRVRLSAWRTIDQSQKQNLCKANNMVKKFSVFLSRYVNMFIFKTSKHFRDYLSASLWSKIQTRMFCLIKIFWISRKPDFSF